jgi:hypothetical protein
VIVSGATESDQYSNVEDKVKDEKKRTYIIQRYIDRPLLINRRKFDI